MSCFADWSKRRHVTLSINHMFIASRSSVRPRVTFSTSGSSYFHVPLTTVRHLLTVVNETFSCIYADLLWSCEMWGQRDDHAKCKRLTELLWLLFAARTVHSGFSQSVRSRSMWRHAWTGSREVSAVRLCGIDMNGALVLPRSPILWLPSVNVTNTVDEGPALLAGCILQLLRRGLADLITRCIRPFVRPSVRLSHSAL